MSQTGHDTRSGGSLTPLDGGDSRCHVAKLGWNMEPGCQVMMSLFLLCSAEYLWGQMVLAYICQLNFNVLGPREESTVPSKDALQRDIEPV